MHACDNNNEKETMKLRWNRRERGGYIKGWRKGGEMNVNTIFMYEIINFNFERILMLMRREGQRVELQICLPGVL